MGRGEQGRTRPTWKWNWTRNRCIEGHDPQLERAVAVALEKMKENPPPVPHQPPYPDYQRPATGGASMGGRAR